jgi:hypothetical protein
MSLENTRDSNSLPMMLNVRRAVSVHCGSILQLQSRAAGDLTVWD